MPDKEFHIDASLSVGFHKENTTEEPDVKLLENKYKYMLMIQEQEKDRRRTVEHKASLFLTSNAIVGSLLVWSSRILFEEWRLQTFILSFVLLILIVLLARTIFFTLEVLKKCTYEVLDQNDAVDYKTEYEFYQEMEKKIRRVIENNQAIINKKVDNMAISQKNYRLFWLVMVVYLFVVFGFQLFSAVSFVSFLANVSIANVLLFVVAFFTGLSLGNFNQ